MVLLRIAPASLKFAKKQMSSENVGTRVREVVEGSYAFHDSRMVVSTLSSALEDHHLI